MEGELVYLKLESYRLTLVPNKSNQKLSIFWAFPIVNKVGT